MGGGGQRLRTSSYVNEAVYAGYLLILCGALIGGALRGLFTGRITAAYKPIGIVRYTRLSAVSRDADPFSFWLFTIAYLAIGLGGIYVVLTRPELFLVQQ